MPAFPESMPPPDAQIESGQSIARWITPVGVAIGLLWMGAFRGAGLIFGDPDFTQVRAINALAPVILECLLTGPGLLYGLARATGDRNSTALHPVPFILTILTYWVFIESLPSYLGWYPPRDDPRHFLNFLYPLATLRPLLLAPIWSRWAILLAAGIGRAAPHADPTTRRLCSAVHPSSVFRWMLVPLVPTIAYTLRQQRLFGGFVAVLFVLLVTYLAALVFARRHAGQTRETLQGSAAIAQMAFLAAYRALCV